jgi:hypothetical protein
VELPHVIRSIMPATYTASRHVATPAAGACQLGASSR